MGHSFPILEYEIYLDFWAVLNFETIEDTLMTHDTNVKHRQTVYREQGA